jgi:hypothetical protein
MSAPAARRGGGDSGQAQVELIAAIPVVVCVGAVILQLLAVGYAQSLADGSAEAGAYAVAAGESGEDAALGALPRWAAERAQVSARGGRVSVSIEPPSLLGPVGERLAVDSSAWARPPGSGG